MTSAFQQTAYLFNPLNLSGCIAWFDGNDTSTMFQDIGKTVPVTQNNQLLAAWVDKSANAVTSVNLSGNSATYPRFLTNTINKKATIYFSGNQYLRFAPTGYPTGATPTTFFFLVNSPSSGSSGIWMVFNYGSDKPFGQAQTFGSLAQFYFQNGNLGADYYGPNTGTVDGTLVTNIPSMMTTQYSGTDITGWRNGTLFSGGTSNPFTYSANVGSNYGFIGVGVAGGNFSQYFTGNVAEIIGYNRALTTLERQQVEGYLSWKWGTNGTLPVTHPFYYNTTYALNPIPLGGPSNTGPFYQRPFLFVSPFKPTLIPGCTLWFDANDQTTMTLSGSNLTTWVSKGNQYASTINISNVAFYSNLNGYPSIFFNSNAKLNVNPINYGSANGTTWITCARNLAPITPSSPPDASVVLATEGAGAQRAIRFNPTGAITIYTINNGLLRGASGCNADGIRGFIDTPAYFAAYQNGGPPVSNATSVSYQAGTNQGFTIGQWNTGFLYGHIYEMIVYNSALTVSQYQQVESYLAYKWGFQTSQAPGNPTPSTFGIYSFPPMPNYPIQTYPTSVTCVRWIPSLAPNLVGWYDAADPTQVVVSGTAVTLWRDKSGQGNNTTSANGSPQYRSTYLNKKPGITFNGSSSYFSIPVIVRQDWSIFIVLTTTQTGPTGPLWWTGAGIFDAEVGGTTTDFGTSLNGSSFAAGTGNPPTGDETVFSATAINTGSPFLCEFLRVSSSGFFEVFVTGTSQGSATGGSGSRLAPTRITIGTLQTIPSSSYFFNGTIYEIVVYSSYLSAGQRQNVEGYLAWKWGFVSQLPSSHPFKLFPPPP